MELAMGKVTLKDLASRLGVSTTLVSRVLNAPLREDGTPDCDISRETAARVLELARQMDYRPSRFATGLRRGKRFLIGVITPDISNYAFSETGRIIEELAHRDGYCVMFGSSAESAVRMGELLDVFLGYEVDGIIVTPSVGCEDSLRRVVSKGVPLVLINRDVPALEGVGLVSLDNESSMHQVVDHLFARGYRKIEMISERMEVLSLRDREKGFADRMRSYCLDPYIYMVDSTRQESQVQEAVRAAFAKGTEALITPRIRLSLIALRTMRESGIRIPEEMGIFCHDDNPAFLFHSPTISYVSQVSDQVGARSYEMLKEMMATGIPGGKVLIEPSLHFGGSTSARLHEREHE